MKTLTFLSLLSLFFVSCGSTNYFLKEVSAKDPHASISLRDGTTQVIKIDGKYPPEDAGHSIRLAPGAHTLEVSSQMQQTGFLNSFLGAPGREITSQTTMQVDLAPGKSYRPSCNVGGRGAAFFLIDQTGHRSNFTRAYSRAY